MNSAKKPSILFIHNLYLQKGGEDSVVHNEIDTLKKYGFKVYYKEYNNLAYKNLNPKTLLVPLNFFFNFFVFLNTLLLVKKHKIDVVHVHNFYYTISPSVFWGAKLAGAKTVCTIHNYRLFCLNGLFFLNGKICTHCNTNNSFSKGIREKCFKNSGIMSSMLASSTLLHRFMGTWKSKVDQFVVINPFMKPLLIQKGVDPSKIILKSNYSKEIGFNDYENRDDFYLFAGRLQTEKGIHHLIRAFQLSNKKLVIAGDGELAPWIKENSSDQIIYLGHQSAEELKKLYLKCKALIFPSLWLEGMPMTIIEAQSAGVIPIVARTVTTEGMITDQYDGFLYEAGNSDSLIEAITRFEDKSITELNTLSNNARQKFLKEYEEKQHMYTIESIYQ